MFLPKGVDADAQAGKPIENIVLDMTDGAPVTDTTAAAKTSSSSGELSTAAVPDNNGYEDYNTSTYWKATPKHALRWVKHQRSENRGRLKGGYKLTNGRRSGMAVVLNEEGKSWQGGFAYSKERDFSVSAAASIGNWEHSIPRCSRYSRVQPPSVQR